MSGVSVQVLIKFGSVKIVSDFGSNRTNSFVVINGRKNPNPKIPQHFSFGLIQQS